jgi:DNA-binding helix-hairpin-helix protein with protein kinase domain
VRLFGLRVRSAGPTGTVDVSALWNAILAVPPPPPDPPLPSEKRWTYPAEVRQRKKRAEQARVVVGAGLAISAFALYAAVQSSPVLLLLLAVCGVAFAAWPRIPRVKRRMLERRYAKAEARWKAALRRWKHDASEARFTQQKAELDKARAALVDLPGERMRRLRQLESDRELYQRLRYLDRFRIDAANLHGIGPGRTAMLEAYGVETAADIEEPAILQIPSFGPALTAELVAWRRRHEANFRLNSAEPVDPRDIAEVERQLSQRRQELLEKLRKGPDTLKQISGEIVEARRTLMPELEQAWQNLKIAQFERNAP